MIALDTMILIWGIKEESHPDQQDKILAAKHLLEKLSEKGTKPLISSVTLSELIIRLPADKQVETINYVSNHFQVVPFDSRSALKNARIWADRKEKGLTKANPSENETKAKLKADCQIVSSLSSYGASTLISNDKGIKKFGEGVLEVKEIDEENLQYQLF